MRTLGNKSKLTGWTAALIAVVATAVAWQAIAAPPTGGGSAGSSNNSFAVGGISLTDGDHLAFAAQLSPKGAIAGHVVQDALMVQRSGPVVCVTFYNGNMATVGWMVTYSSDSTEVGQFRTFEVTDNGPPVGGVSTDLFLDRMTMDQDCSDMSGGGVMPVHGNIVVKYAP
jgi:hypothetical protein